MSQTCGRQADCKFSGNLLIWRVQEGSITSIIDNLRIANLLGTFFTMRVTHSKSPDGSFVSHMLRRF